MSVVKDVVGGLAPIIGIGALIGGIWLFRDQIKSWFVGEVPGVGTVAETSQTPVYTATVTGETVTAGEVAQMGAGVTGLVQGLLNIGSTFWNEFTSSNQPVTEVSPVTGNPIVYQPSQVSEYVATNAYLPGVTLIPENQDTLWRPSAEKIGQIFDKSEFRPGETDVYEIWRLTGTGTTQILATGVGVGPSQGGIDPSAWDTVFKAGTYEVIWL